MEIIRESDNPGLGVDLVHRYPLAGIQNSLDHFDYNHFDNKEHKWPNGQPHQHTDFEEFWFILKGKARVFNSGNWIEIKAGDMVIHKPNEPHMMEADSDVWWLCFAKKKD